MADVATLLRHDRGADWHDSFFLLASDPVVEGLEGVFAAIAGTRLPVLIVGEEGTGRTSAAHAIHRMDFGSDEGLIELAASQASEEVIAAALSAAQAGQDGAAPATLLLEEITELDASCQWRLLQMLKTGQTACRVIATSSKGLEADAHSGRLREDLLYCLNRICLSLPPLRHRKRDIAAFIEFFLTKYAIVFHRSKPELSAAARQALLEHAWPGNLTELENTVRTLLATDDEELALAALRRQAPRRARAVNGEDLSLKNATRVAVRRAERELIAKALARTQGNRKRAAAELKISYKALLYKLKENEITGFPKPRA